ncbi:hypothetical protein AYO37_00145 [Opitutia bacterium SCGC AG-212-L18]|nr:hypothetical protein AYO37_00145 [Opitutae bacterium SCGC AG-212-L18]
MKQQKNKLKQDNSGFTMVEVIVIVSVLAVLAGIASLIMGDTVNAAKDNKRKINAMLMNKQMSQIYALGGLVGEGVGKDVDTTSIKTVIDSLTRTPPLKVEGITFAFAPKPEEKEYENYRLVDGLNHKLVEAVLTPVK